VIDLHSHILPGMDDGSQSIEESLALIRMQAEQGIRIVVATPHFLANSESVDSFLARREKAALHLQEALPADMPAIRLGAEVRYYEGISRLEGLSKLRIENSKLLLLEMPMMRWSESILRELCELASRSRLKLVLAHVERYLSFQDPSAIDRLCENGVLLQANASFFLSLCTRHKALLLLKKGYLHFVGSDCHGIGFRPPKIGKAFAVIEKKFGKTYLLQMNEYGNILLEHK
jgi:protein-tyrosine phosphatase